MHCGLKPELIEALFQQGLLDKHEGEEADFFCDEDMEFLRRVRRLHDELGVNLAGIEVIHHMRERILALQAEMRRLRNEVLQQDSGDVAGQG